MTRVHDNKTKSKLSNARYDRRKQKYLLDSHVDYYFSSTCYPKIRKAFNLKIDNNTVYSVKPCTV